MPCGNCAYYVDNFFYGYQVYCTMPTQYWLNTGGMILLVPIAIIIGICIVHFELKILDYFWKRQKIKKI